MLMRNLTLPYNKIITSINLLYPKHSDNSTMVVVFQILKDTYNSRHLQNKNILNTYSIRIYNYL